MVVHDQSNQLQALLESTGAAIMGIVNTTPDSFSDGGLFMECDSAVRHACSLVEQGADILDIGGESTRPGAQTVSLQQELDRVIPVIERLTKMHSVPISIDTSKPEVMRAAVNAGAVMINDVNALRAEGAVKVAKDADVHVCLMHMLGDPTRMQLKPVYSDVVTEVVEFLEQRVESCEAQGIKKSKILLDPGIGFGKTLEHNLQLLASIDCFRAALGCDVLIGVSRKSMIDTILEREVGQRVDASVGLAVQAVCNGAKIVRVHDVQQTYDAVRCVEAVMQINQNKLDRQH